MFPKRCLQRKSWGLCILLLFISPFSCFSNFRQAKEIIYKIKEGLPKGTLIGDLGSDLNLDFSVDPALSFSLALQDISGVYVSLNDTTGKLFTSDREIDRETVCSKSSECVLALDVLILPQQNFRLVKVKLVVEDVNDNQPSFPSAEIRLFVPENAPVNSRFAVEQAVATDPDAGPHGLQTYWLDNDHGIFTLDVEENESGELTPFLIVAGPLDRETKSEYVTSIVAEDGGTPPLLGTATLKIVITDVNDNCPRFAESVVNVTVYGNTTQGARLAHLRAFDPDLGDNAKIMYAYSDRVPADARRLFGLDEVTGVIQLDGKINQRTGPYYKLTVLAIGPGCIPVVATVTLHVIRMSFDPPAVMARYIAPETGGVVTLKESEPPFTPIAFFTITNAQQEPHVGCQLEGQGPFRLLPYKSLKNEYLLETTDLLDYEKTQTYELTVAAGNSDDPVIKKLIKVQVVDENDNSPVFRHSLLDLFVEENNAPHTFLTKLVATDEDSEARGEVAYLLGSDAPPFMTLDRVTGALVVSTSLDREEKEKYRFTVRAVDHGSPSKETLATVVLTVLDRNDNSPRFLNKEFTFFVPENFPGLGEIGVLSVSDADSGKNGWVALSILNGSDTFIIDTGRGALRAKTPLDREQQGTYLLWVEAVDGGEPSLSCVTKVTILLLDVNDNPPVVMFPQSNRSYMLLLPSTLPGTPVTEVYAVDRDAGMNAVIAYSIIKRTGGEPGSFHIDPNTGNITLMKTLNDRGLYSLLVKASDHGQPQPLHSTVRVNLFVNETVSNESYVQSLLTSEAEVGAEEHPLDRLVESMKRSEEFPCQFVSIALSLTCLWLLLTVIALTACLCGRKQRKRRKKVRASEVEIPLRTSADFQVMDRKIM